MDILESEPDEVTSEENTYPITSPPAIEKPQTIEERAYNFIQSQIKAIVDPLLTDEDIASYPIPRVSTNGIEMRYGPQYCSISVKVPQSSKTDREYFFISHAKSSRAKIEVRNYIKTKSKTPETGIGNYSLKDFVNAPISENNVIQLIDTIRNGGIALTLAKKINRSLEENVDLDLAVLATKLGLIEYYKMLKPSEIV
jgi:hypothetical protein